MSAIFSEFSSLYLISVSPLHSGSCLDTLLKESVEAIDTAADAQIDGSFSKVNNETSLNRRVDLLYNFDSLSLAGIL